MARTSPRYRRSIARARERETFVGDGSISLDARAKGGRRRDPQDERRPTFTTTIKARGVFAVEFTWNPAIGSIPRPVASRRESRRSPALIERPALASSFLLSLFLFLPFSLSLSLSLSFSSPAWLVSCASPVNHGDSYFCTSSSSSAIMPDYLRCRDFSRDSPRFMQSRRVT